MRVLKPYLVLLLTVYLLVLVATAPATLFEKILTAQPGLTLEHLAGSLWHGTAEKLSMSTRVGTVQISALQWDMQWRYLFRGDIALKFEMADAVGSLTVARGFGGFRLVQVDLALPAEELAQILPQLGLWQPGGEVQFKTEEFVLAATAPSAALLIWRNATLNLSPLQPLGDYRLQLRKETNGTINAQLQTLAGKLQLAGAGAYSKQAGLQFNGSASARRTDISELQALLALLGKDRGDGVHDFSLLLP